MNAVHAQLPRSTRQSWATARRLLFATLLPCVVTVTVRAQPAPLPAARGYVNDFANVISPQAAQQLDELARIVQTRSGGEIAIVTLPDLESRPVEETALRIGREWGVGAQGEIGDRRRNAGTVILLVPKESSSDNRGYCRIESGMGVEGFITDATAGSICRAATDRFRVTDYSGGLLIVTSAVAEAYANEFGFSLAEGELPVQRVRRSAEPGGGSAVMSIALFLIIMFLASRGRGSGCLPLAIASTMSGPHRGRHHGGYGGGFGGGFGGGGFGGFGGGGGFSGGGGGSSW